MLFAPLSVANGRVVAAAQACGCMRCQITVLPIGRQAPRCRARHIARRPERARLPCSDDPHASRFVAVVVFCSTFVFQAPVHRGRCGPSVFSTSAPVHRLAGIARLGARFRRADAFAKPAKPPTGTFCALGDFRGRFIRLIFGVEFFEKRMRIEFKITCI